MSIIVEDGSVVAGAESYSTVADASAYFTARGVAGWTALASDAIREQSLRKATDYMQQMYGLRWKGLRTQTDQPLDWPRQQVEISDGVLDPWVPSNTIPVEIKNACIELALRSATETLAPDVERSKLEVKVGPVEVKYDPLLPTYKRFRAIDAMVSRYLKSTGPVMSLRRV